MDPPAFSLDPGAKRLIEQIIPHLDFASTAGTKPPIRITLGGITNQSHSSREEFEEFIDRLATVLSRVARPHDLIFLPAEAGEPDSQSPGLVYQCRGSAYLIMAQGFDQWELHLRLTSAPEDDSEWTLWESPQPIRIIRHSRPGEPQFLPVLP